MNLEKRIRVIGLQAQINALSRMVLGDEETELLARKKAELEQVNPTPPPFPTYENDLRCTRQEIVDDVERLTRKAQPLLDQIERETDPARKARLEFEEIIARLRRAQERLARWDQLRTYMLWRAEQADKNAGR